MPFRQNWVRFQTQTFVDEMKFSIVSYSEVDTVATGGKGDREIFVYKANKAGKFTQLHCLRGHTGT